MTVQAAGGVVIRHAGTGDEVLVVHRPQYDDWSLPKGKLEPGESHENAARREVAEETGIVGELGAELTSIHYVDRHGRDKTVRYWKMTAVGTAAWKPNDEVDEVRWIPVRDVAALLSYDGDQALVAEAMQAAGEAERGGDAR